MSERKSRPFWHFLTAALIVAVLVAYPLSYPWACAWMIKSGRPDGGLDLATHFYTPFGWAINACPESVRDLYADYNVWSLRMAGIELPEHR